MECDALLYCDFFELLVEVTGGDMGAALCSGLELPFDSSPGNDEGGVGGKPKSKKFICKLTSMNDEHEIVQTHLKLAVPF